MATIKIIIKDRGIEATYYAVHERETEETASFIKIEQNYQSMRMYSDKYSPNSLREIIFQIEHGAMNGGIDIESIEKRIILNNIAF
ncbi:MAG: hypothetical protein V1888_01500 [archaeon]